MENGVKLTVEELSERWQWLTWGNGIEQLRVTEQFPKREVHSYIVEGLTMEFEDEIVICSDCKDVLIDNVSILMGFLKKCLLSIMLFPIGNDLYQERLEFENGLILIETV